MTVPRHPLRPAERRQALWIAREAVRRWLAGDPTPVPVRPELGVRRGVFVTLKRDGELRGCIGWPEAAASLGVAVARCAVAAASEDPRFPPVKAEELPGLRIEISVLTPLQRVGSPLEVEVGRDGLLVEQGPRRGLLLPQVATEHGWDRTTFLGQACRKAGLPADAWRSAAVLYRFEAEVFGEGETEPLGP